MYEINNIAKKIGIKNVKIIKMFKPSIYSYIVVFEGIMNNKHEKFVLKKGELFIDVLKNIDKKESKILFKGEFDVLKKVRKLLGNKFMVPEPIYFSEKDMVFITKFLNGETIKKIFLRGEKCSINIFFKIGQKLRLFHDKMPSSSDNEINNFEILKKVNLPKEIKKKIIKNYNFYINKNDIKKTAYHDVTLWNVLIDDKGNIKFLDMPPYLKKRSIYYDLSYFINSIYLTYIKFSDIHLLRNMNYLNLCSQAFLDGYCGLNTVINKSKLNFYRIINLIRSLYLQQKRKGFKNKLRLFYLKFRFIRIIKQLMEKNGIV